MSETLGTRLRYARGKHNISQSQLAANIGITRAAISLYEADKMRPREEIINRLSELFGAGPEWFDSGVGKGPQQLDPPEFFAEITVERLTPEVTDLYTLHNGRYWQVPLAKRPKGKPVAIKAPNDAEPIRRGDHVVIDTGRTSHHQGGVVLVIDLAGPANPRLCTGRHQPERVRVIGRVIACLWAL